MNSNKFNISHVLLISSLIIKANANTQCSNESPLIMPKYHLMEKCHRSKLGIAAKANYTSLTSCQRLGIEKKALAFNFVPLEALNDLREKERKKNRHGNKDNGTEPFEPIEYTCEVLKCAEVDGGLSLVNDSRYDYYSLYAKPFPHVNAICIPAVGMFFLTPYKLNYTQARSACRNMSSVLADVVSEARTEALAQVLSGAGVETAFVALRRTNGSAFYGANGDSLDCTTYRAWAPGHPRRARHKFDCVVTTRQKTWRTTSCKQRHPALCELNPGGPYKRGSIFASLKPINNTETGTQDEDQ